MPFGRHLNFVQIKISNFRLDGLNKVVNLGPFVPFVCVCVCHTENIKINYPVNSTIYSNLCRL